MDVIQRVRRSGTLSLLRYGKLSHVTSALSFFDDFDWNSYTKTDYRHDILGTIEPRFTTRLESASFCLRDGVIELGEAEKPLHPDHRLIYETAVQLRPASVFECGYGAGDHLVNIKTLMPDVQIAGADIGGTQREFAWERNPSLVGSGLEVLDLTVPGIAGAARGDFVYCNAVVMHIQRGARHLDFLRNMFALSKRYVLVRENWRRHRFVHDLQKLFPGVNIYYLPAAGGTGALLLDKRNDSPFEVIDSDARLFA